MKGQFMIISAVVVSLLVLSASSTVAQIQSQTFSPDDEMYHIKLIQEEASKVTENDDKDIENFNKMVYSIEDYSAYSRYWAKSSSTDCFNVTLVKPGTELNLNCLEVAP